MSQNTAIIDEFIAAWASRDLDEIMSGLSHLRYRRHEVVLFQLLDADEYFWEPTEPPFQSPRSIDERQSLLEDDTDDLADPTSFLPYMGESWSRPILTKIRVKLGANDNGGHDNVTVVCALFVEEED